MNYPKIFFHCSLPRSGSTILQNILGQNPDFYVTPTSGLMELIYAARKNFSEVPEFKAEIDQDVLNKAFLQFCNHGLHGFASARTDKKYYIDKGRSWAFYYDWLEKFLPYQPKIICMIRDLRDIFCSQEKLFRSNPEVDNNMINWMNLSNTTIAKRIDTWSTGMPVGIALDRLQANFEMGISGKIHYIKYEDFCLRPEAEMARLYNYLEIPYYNHNFDFIDQVTFENDRLYSMTDHTIRNKLEMKQSEAKQILGDAVCDWIYQRYSWFYQTFKYNK